MVLPSKDEGQDNAWKIKKQCINKRKEDKEAGVQEQFYSPQIDRAAWQARGLLTWTRDLHKT